MTTAEDTLVLARAAFTRRSWKDAYAQFAAADEQSPLAPDDLERMALSAYALNLDTEPFRAWTRAHHEWLKRGQTRPAARCAFQQAAALYTRGEMAPAQGWVARARRLVDEIDEDCAERGWLIEMTGLPQMFMGDNEGALPYFEQAHEIAARFDDADLRATVCQTLGHVLVQLNERERGLALVDEAMVAVTSDEVGPLFAGIAYCQLIQTCQSIFDLRRAREWTDLLTRWCEAQPDLVPYRGDCLVYRSEMFTLLGEWPDAEAIAKDACEQLAAQRAWSTLGSAHYQLAEVFRLRGEFDAAEAQYQRAGEFGREPEPGMSLLRLGQRRTDAARAGIERALNGSERPAERARLLPPFIEIALATGDVDAAEGASEELDAAAGLLETPFLRAIAACARGAVLLARGDAANALDRLRDACRGFQDADAPYEAARTRVLLALASRELGDEESLTRDLEAARAAFERLGAAPDVARVDGLSGKRGALPGGLSQRELEVLVLVAQGKTNKQISVDLVLSENTVARHLQNIFGKLGVSSRSAATAYAFEHRLV